MGPHTRFHLRIDALGASNTSSRAKKGRGGAKASHLRRGAWHLTKVFQKFGDNIAKAIKVSGFHFLLFKRRREYILIGDEGNGRGHLDIPKVPYN